LNSARSTERRLANVPRTARASARREHYNGIVMPACRWRHRETDWRCIMAIRWRAAMWRKARSLFSPAANPRWQDQQWPAWDAHRARRDTQSASLAITNDQTPSEWICGRKSNSCLSTAQWDYAGSYVMRASYAAAYFRDKPHKLLFSHAEWFIDEYFLYPFCVEYCLSWSK